MPNSSESTKMAIELSALRMATELGRAYAQTLLDQAIELCNRDETANGARRVTTLHVQGAASDQERDSVELQERADDPRAIRFSRRQAG